MKVIRVIKMEVSERTVVERMLGRQMTDEEMNKVIKVDLLDALLWAKNKFMKEKKDGTTL